MILYDLCINAETIKPVRQKMSQATRCENARSFPLTQNPQDKPKDDQSSFGGRTVEQQRIANAEQVHAYISPFRSGASFLAD